MLEQPELRLVRAGERPAHVAEELALEQRLDHRGAVHRDQPAIFPRAEPVQRLRDELLARAGLAGDERRAQVRRHAPDRVEQFLHRRSAADHAVELELLGDVGIETQKRLSALDALAHGDEDVAQPLGFERLREVIERPVLDGRDRRVHARRAGHQDDVTVRRSRLEFVQHRHGVRIRHVHECGIGLQQRNFGAHGAAGAARDDREAEGRRDAFDERLDLRIVVDDQQGRGRRMRRNGGHDCVSDRRACVCMA